jgi:molecular chaperone GrpE
MKSREVRKQQAEYNEIERRLKEKLEQEDAGALSGDPDAPESGVVHENQPEPHAEAANAAEERIQQLESELATVRDQYLRARAEFDNFRKRMEREQQRFRATASEAILRDLLPVLDNLELALQHAAGNPEQVVQGVDMVLRQLREALGTHGLSPIPADGERFDPNVHEAVGQQPSTDIAADHVLTEYQRGYRLGDLVLRPSRVVVSAGQPNNPEPSSESPTGPDDTGQ